MLRIGAPPSSRVLAEWIARSGALVVGLDRFGQVADPQRCVSRSLHADVATVARQLASLAEPAPDAWPQLWQSCERRAREAIRTAFASGPELSEPVVAAELMGALPSGSVLVASSSMPVRDLEWYAPARDGVRVISNRGANGIDGVTSTALGTALSAGPGQRTALLIGDVAFLHDANGLLGAARRGADLAIVVVDNDGGGIFSFLPQREQLEEARFEQLFGTPHGTDLCALAAAHGVAAQRVSTRGGFRAALGGALRRGGVHVIVVPSDRAANMAEHDRLHVSVAESIDDLVRNPGDRPE